MRNWGSNIKYIKLEIIKNKSKLTWKFFLNLKVLFICSLSEISTKCTRVIWANYKCKMSFIYISVSTRPLHYLFVFLSFFFLCLTHAHIFICGSKVRQAGRLNGILSAPVTLQNTSERERGAGGRERFLYWEIRLMINAFALLDSPVSLANRCKAKKKRTDHLVIPDQSILLTYLKSIIKRKATFFLFLKLHFHIT